MMKPRYNGTVTDWHQDSQAWPQFAPQNPVSCWVALDDATVDNGCMTVIPGSHKWGPIDRDYRDRYLDNPLLAEPVAIELKAGSCMFHHGLNFHRTGFYPIAIDTPAVFVISNSLLFAVTSTEQIVGPSYLWISRNLFTSNFYFIIPFSRP